MTGEKLTLMQHSVSGIVRDNLYSEVFDMIN